MVTKTNSNSGVWNELFWQVLLQTVIVVVDEEVVVRAALTDICRTLGVFKSQK